MKQRPVILLLIPHLGGGGAEQVFAHLLEGLSRAKYEIHLGLTTRSSLPHAPVPRWIAVHDLNCVRVRSAAWKLTRLIRRLRPDLVFSGMAHLSLLLLMLRPLFPRGTRVLIRQNALLSQLVDRSARSVPLWISRALYRRAIRIVCQTSWMAAEMGAFLGSERTLLVLPNPVDVSGIRSTLSPQNFGGPGQHLLAVGRLVREKGFDLLLDAYHGVHATFPETDLTILGTGAEGPALREQCERMQLESSVCFAGRVARPQEWLQSATVFVLSSRTEALSNALLEAAAAGLPIVALPAYGGLSQLLSGQEGVWLAKEVSAHALEESLRECLQTLNEKSRFDHAWMEPFRMENAIAQYETLIDEILVEIA